MTFDEYQQQAMTTAIDTSDDFVTAFLYRTLGLVGEAGEVADKIKKIIRDNDGKLDEGAKLDLAKEMGDVLWYLQALSDYLGIPFEQIAQINLDKLQDRKARNTLRGSGDNR